MTPPRRPSETRKQVSVIFERLLLDYERLVGGRVTPELIRSPEWKELQKEYRRLWLPLMKNEEQKG